MKLTDDFLVRQSTCPRFNTPPRIDESCLLIGDAQVPYHDHELINHCKRVAFAWGIRTCVWAGDMIDLATLSPFISSADGLDIELDQDELYLTQIASGFEKVIWTMGNHEDRFFRSLEKIIGAERITKLLGLDTGIVQTSNYYFCEIGDDWLAEHPKNSSVIPGRVAALLAEKYKKNVMTFHGHTTGEAQDRSGEYLGIDVGIVADPLRIEYVNLKHSIRPAMTQGAAILRKNKNGTYCPYHLNKFTDWDAMERMGNLWHNSPRLNTKKNIPKAKQRRR